MICRLPADCSSMGAGSALPAPPSSGFWLFGMAIFSQQCAGFPFLGQGVWEGKEKKKAASCNSEEERASGVQGVQKFKDLFLAPHVQLRWE